MVKCAPLFLEERVLQAIEALCLPTGAVLEVEAFRPHRVRRLALTLVFGAPLALILARRRFPGSTLVDSLVDLPIVLPPAVAGLALLLAFGRRGVLGPPLAALGIEPPFTTAAVIVASFFVAAPFFVRAARSGFLAVPPELEEAAGVEGATEWQVFYFVTAPVAASALFGGAVLAWARALGEFGATVMFAGQFEGRTQTMPLAIYAALETDLDAALGLSMLLLGISLRCWCCFDGGCKAPSRARKCFSGGKARLRTPLSARRPSWLPS